MRYVIPTLAAAALASGCGSGGAAQTHTVTATVAASTPPTTTATTQATTALSPADVQTRLAALSLKPHKLTAANVAHGVVLELRNTSNTLEVGVYKTTADATSSMLRLSGDPSVAKALALGFHLRRFENVILIGRLLGPAVQALS